MYNLPKFILIKIAELTEKPWNLRVCRKFKRFLPFPAPEFLTVNGKKIYLSDSNCFIDYYGLKKKSLIISTNYTPFSITEILEKVVETKENSLLLLFSTNEKNYMNQSFGLILKGGRVPDYINQKHKKFYKNYYFEII